MPRVLEQGDFQEHRYASLIFGRKPPKSFGYRQTSQKSVVLIPAFISFLLLPFLCCPTSHQSPKTINDIIYLPLEKINRPIFVLVPRIMGVVTPSLLFEPHSHLGLLPSRLPLLYLFHRLFCLTAHIMFLKKKKNKVGGLSNFKT